MRGRSRSMSLRIRILASTAAVTLSALAWSCTSGGNPTGPNLTSGTVSVGVTTTGADAPATFMVSLDGGATRSIGANGVTSFTGVAAGTHSVTLAAIPGNCTLSGTNPRTTTVAGGGTASVAFTVSCVPLTGNLEVTTATTGSDLDPDGYTLSVDGGTTVPAGINETLAAVVLPVGPHELELGGVADNCMVTGANPRPVTVAEDETVEETFDVMCDATTGSVEVTTTTSGPDPDADGYTVDLDGVASRAIGPNETVTFTGVSEGAHSVTLTGIAGNCAVTGDNPIASTVVAGEAVDATFDLTCVALIGDLRVTATTTGSPVDPDGYTVSVDGGAPQALGVADDTITFAAVPAGDRSVLLSGVDAGCVVGTPNPATAAVPAGGEVLQVFDVSCTSDLGSIELTTVTTGLDPDPDGYTVSLDGDTPAAIGNDALLVFDDLAAGSHSLLLADIAANCSVQGANPEMPIVMGNQTTDVTMTVDCADIPNLVPVVAIAAPDTTSSVAPLSVTPGTSVTFTGSALDAEDGALTGASLVWTSNVDGQIGTGETFMTSSLSEGQHTITLTATDSEAGSGTETVFVIVTPPSSGGYQVTFRLAEGTILTPGQAAAIGGAIARLESIVVGDVPDLAIDFAAAECGPGMPVLDEVVDDLLIYLSVVVIDGPGGILGAAGPCFVRLGSFLPAVGVMIFDAADFAGLEVAGQVDEVWGHEAMHIMGFGTIWNALGFLEDPTSPGNGGMSGNDTYFDGPAAITQFGVLDPGGDYTGGNVVPVENDDQPPPPIFGPGSLDSHWREGVFFNELMTPAINPGPTNPLSILTIGQFEDLGYSVDYGSADPYSPIFNLRADDAAPALHLGDDIWRGPLWVGSPGGTPHRIR